MEFQTILGSAELPRDGYELSRGTLKVLIRSLVENKVAFKLSLDVQITNESFMHGASPVSIVKKLLSHGLPEDVDLLAYRNFGFSRSPNISVVLSHKPQQKGSIRG